MSSLPKLAIGFVPLLVIALLFGAYVSLIPTTTSSANLTQNYNFPNAASTTNDSLGLTLSLVLNYTSLFKGQGVNITVYVTNERSTLNNISDASNWSEIWFIGGGMIDSCNSFANAEVFQGYYTQSNISNLQPGSELQLAKPIFLECPALGGPWFTYFPFQSNETRVGYQYSTAGNYGPANSSTSTFTVFSPGVYTVAAGDEWGQMVILHFEFSGKSPVEVVSVTGPIPPITPAGATIAITLKNVGGLPMISLNATLNLSPLSYSFIFDVNSSNSLLAGNSINTTQILVGASYYVGNSYPLTVTGMLSNGVSFSFTQQVMIVQPS